MTASGPGSRPGSRPGPAPERAGGEAELLAPGTAVDLTNCDREPIHVPGSIQPRGVLLVVDEPALVVRQVSANLADLAQVGAAHALGRPLAAVLGAQAAAAVARATAPFGDLRERNPVETVVSRRGERVPVDAILHRASLAEGPDGPSTALVIECEPARGPRPFAFPNTYQAVRRAVADLNRAGELEELYAVTVVAVRALTGFDRVMVYRYDADYNGEVVAEARRDGLDSFLGLHYPASDIPAQARALYEKNWVRLISDVDYVPAPLVPEHHPATGAPLDLTYATLRSVSPIHVAYLHNMGVRASMSISLLRGDRLWGLIACHHYAGPHVPPYAVRAAAEFLGSTLSLRLVDRAEREEDRLALRARSTLAWLTAATLDEDKPLTAALLGSPSLLDLVPADGVVLTVGGQRQVKGRVPDPEVVAAVADWVAAQGRDVVVTDSLPLQAPDRPVPAESVCGVLGVSLPEGQSVLWLRREAVLDVDWGGDPATKAVAEREGDSLDPVRLSPRRSFERWREVVRNRSEPWTAEEVDSAAQLRAHLLEALYARSQRLVRAATTLQRSLLTDPPQPDDLQIAARYVAATREAQVGGDWYDAFVQPDGTTVLVVGDVVGHDMAAAAAMGQLRGLLRGIGYARAAGPAAVLTRLDEAMEGLLGTITATVVIARLEQTPEEREQGLTRLRWSSAGHLPPMVAQPDGTVTALGTAHMDLLLGIDPATPREDAEVVLPRGATILLYTDGLVERRYAVLDKGLEELRATVARCADRPLDDLCADVLDLVPGEPEDDVALLAVRLHPQ